MLVEQAATGGSVQTGLEEMIEIYNEKFGLNTPLWKQYLNYLGDMSRFDFNYSIANYPQRVSDIIGRAMPWTIGLAHDDDALLVGPRHAPRRLHGLAARAQVPLVSDAAVALAQCDPVLPARTDADLFLAFRMRLFPLSVATRPEPSPR